MLLPLTDRKEILGEWSISLLSLHLSFVVTKLPVTPESRMAKWCYCGDYIRCWKTQNWPSRQL